MEGKNNTQNEQQGLVIPREYFIDGIKEAKSQIWKMEAAAKLKYGQRYNWKNSFEECERRFGFSDNEKILNEYELICNKQSKQPAVIRRVIEQMGDSACRYALNRYQEEQRKKKEES